MQSSKRVVLVPPSSTAPPDAALFPWKVQRRNVPELAPSGTVTPPHPDERVRDPSKWQSWKSGRVVLAPLMYTVPAMPELEPRKVQPRNRGEELTTEIVPPRLLMPRPGTVLLMNSHAGWSKERRVRGSGV